MQTKRAVLYARVSSDDRAQDSRNLRGQLDLCRQHALARGWTVVAELAEDERGVGGARLDLPMLNRAIELAQRGEFEVLVVRELDRLSRSLPKQLHVEQALFTANVQIAYVLGDYPDTPEGRFMRNVRAAVAELERFAISERTARGRLYADTLSGSVLCCPPYGYQLLEEGQIRQLSICLHEAEVVRQVFAWYTIGDEDGVTLSTAEIARRLTDGAIPTYSQARSRKVRQGVMIGQWSPVTVSDILHNPVYKGEWRAKKFYMHNGQKTPRLPNEQLVVAVPPIVDLAMWDTAQTQLIARRHMTKRGSHYKCLLAGHIWCGLCNTRAFGKLVKAGDYMYYSCGTKFDDHYRKHACACQWFRGEPIETSVWTWLVSLVTHPGPPATAFRAQQRRWKRLAAPLRAQRVDIEAQRKECERQQARLLDLYLTGSLAKETWARRQDALQHQLRHLREQQTKLQAELEKYTLDQEQFQTVQRNASQLLARIQAHAHPFDLKRKLFDVIDLHVRLCLDAEDKQYVQARCVLGQETFALSDENVV